MFDLVADVEKYPSFIPHCAALRVLSSSEGEARGALTAEMVVAYLGFREKFRCRVELERAARRIRVEYLDGPFRRLHNEWRFTDISGGSEIDFTIEFEFKNILLQAAASAVFERVFLRMSEAFIERAHVVYGGGALRPT